MKRSLYVVIVTILIFTTTLLIFNGCSKKENPSGEGVTVEFPLNDNGKTDYNAYIYDIEPFVLSFDLPDGWELRDSKPEDIFNLATLYTPLYFYDENEECIGVLGYNVYELYEGVEDDPRAIYGQIALGNNYQFDVRESYNAIKETENGVTAVVDVYYSASINDGVEKYNRGIVSYNKDLLVYIAIELVSGITDEQILKIAESIVIS